MDHESQAPAVAPRESVALAPTGSTENSTDGNGQVAYAPAQSPACQSHEPTVVKQDTEGAGVKEEDHISDPALDHNGEEVAAVAAREEDGLGSAHAHTEMGVELDMREEKEVAEIHQDGAPPPPFAITASSSASRGQPADMLLPLLPLLPLPDLESKPTLHVVTHQIPQDHNPELDITTEMAIRDAVPPLAPELSIDTHIPPTSDVIQPFSSQELMEAFQEQASQPPPATGFAKLEFQDGHFYMTTYAVELGRDMRAYRVAQQQQARVHIKPDQEPKHARRSASVPGTPVRPIKNDGAVSVPRSFLSESGGIVGEDDGHINLKKKKKKKSSKSRSTDTSSSRSHSMSRKNSISQVQPKYDYHQAALMTVDPNATAPLDPMVHMPDPHFTPLIPVHPPMNSDEPFPTGKGISRKHIRISYNFDQSYFEMAVYGRNGAFHDDQHYPEKSIVALHDGSVIQIGGVTLKFVLPTTPLDDQDGEDFESVSGRMSFGFEDGRGESIIADDESNADSFDQPMDQVFAQADEYEGFDVDDDEDLLDDDGEDDDEESSDESIEETPKKRGPGRPKAAAKMPPPSKSTNRRASKTLPSSASKKVPKISIKLSTKDKAREKERARLKAEAEARRQREREREEARKLKVERKEEARKAKVRAEKDARIEQEVKEQTKDESKEPSKTPAGDAPTSKEASAPRISRDAPMQNGEDITVPGLPAGVIIPARKKGPGRPPKDGVMSKRERALLIKQAKEREKAIKLGLDPSTIPTPENKPAKPRPRRNSQGEEIEGDNPDGDDEKRPKVPRPPRSPSPEMRIEDYSEEQLQRPSSNYVYLIYEAIQNSKAGVMNLQQIYSAIERKYPWYKFKAGSNGWQSSVRHNLGQHEAFKKVEKEGKGWLWGIKEGVPIERERKKKSPPPQPPPSQYPHPYQYPQYGAYPPYPAGGPGPGQYPQQRPPGNMVPPNMQQHPRPPAVPGQSPNGNAQYSSPYAKDMGKAGEGSNQPPRPNQYPPPGPYPPPPGGYRPQYPPPPGQTHPPPFRRYRPPAPDVIDTFKKVFISTYASKEGNNTTKAETIVNNAIKRVLEPETMVNIPKDSQEEGVIRAFEGILVQSQAPPRQPTPSHPPPMGSMNHIPPALSQPPPRPPPPPAAAAASPPVVSAAGSAALTAVASSPAAGSSTVAGSGQAANTVPALKGGQAMAPGPAANSAVPLILTGSTDNQATTPGQNSAAVRLQGPAETNLLGMLMASGPARSNSNTPSIARSTSPAVPAPGQASNYSNQAISTAPLIGPVAPLIASTNGTTTNTVTASAVASRLAATAPVNGLGLNINSMPKDANIERINRGGTMTPTRPMVEPLTPPAVRVGSPMFEQSNKRARSPTAAGEEGDAKKPKVDA